VAARFSAPVQTGHEIHPSSYTMDIGIFSGVKRQVRGVEVKEKVELYLYSPFGRSWPVLR
jgi:hypothetical protein